MSSNTKEYNQAYYLKHRDKMLGYSRLYRRTHAEGIKKYKKEGHFLYVNRLSGMERNHLTKIEILSHYSNPQETPICNNCGEQDIDVLCLDHIYGGGSRHARSRKTTLYSWILQNGYPGGFQVLCGNCNSKKARLEFFTSQVKSYSVAPLGA